ncbi:MAG: histidine phosphatase family protein, partial [Propioniciclava sp.]|nr:histidine phosphatase family protein [Propioniciclava sp.]
ADVILRVRSILVELQERFHGERVWLFSHEAVILAFRYVVEGLDEQRVVALQKEEPLANCSMTRYRAVDGALQLVRADDTRPVEESDEAHVTHETDDAAEDAGAGQDT